ncbi:YkuJ family protein [Granulicatella seriolae]|uniref:YkuJ family protein n=1 Tax=Granulicatella seriolae TaxID=2967226 RepID=A0ABT1WNI1_9LACT|nr:YkuJ family protein [Granulicatella seriolae]
MRPSQLVAIVNRLQTMADQETDIEIRRFEKEGVEKCIVTFDQESDSFELEDLDANQTFQFDDIDLVAIEIYEILQN